MVDGRSHIARLLRLWVPLGFFLVLALFPFYWMAITSLKSNAELYNTRMMPLLVRHPTLKHYVALLTETHFLAWTWNTMLVAIISTLISLVFGGMLAYPLARMRFPGAGLIAMGIAAVYLVPQPLLFIPLADLITRLQLGNTLSAVILTYPTMLVPFCAWLLMGYFKTGLFQDGAEGARRGGADRWR
jgi:multiple sugar transport system permease protein